jgi:hypothetical protein
VSRELAAIVALVGLLVAAWVGYGIVFAEGGESVVVATLSGDVSVSGAPGAAGAAVRASDRVVSGAGGRAVLEVRDGRGEATARISVDPSTSIRLLQVDAAGARLELEGGRVRATVRPGGDRVGVVAAGREISVADADAVVARDGDVVGVEALKGAVELLGVAGVERLAEGERVTVSGEGLLRAPVTDALLLYVAPTRERTREDHAEVQGRCAPGAVVRVRRAGASVDAGAGGWVETRADTTGAFVAVVPLIEGDNTLVIEARDVFGAVAVSEARVVRDTTAPSGGVIIRY